MAAAQLLVVAAAPAAGFCGLLLLDHHHHNKTMQEEFRALTDNDDDWMNDSDNSSSCCHDATKTTGTTDALGCDDTTASTSMDGGHAVVVGANHNSNHCHFQNSNLAQQPHKLFKVTVRSRKDNIWKSLPKNKKPM